MPRGCRLPPHIPRCRYAVHYHDTRYFAPCRFDAAADMRDESDAGLMIRAAAALIRRHSHRRCCRRLCFDCRQRLRRAVTDAAAVTPAAAHGFVFVTLDAYSTRLMHAATTRVSTR